MFNNTIYPTFWHESSSLFFNEIFADATEFVDKVESIGTDTENLADLYYLLVNKYGWSRTRYMYEVPFILALKRELQIS